MKVKTTLTLPLMSGIAALLLSIGAPAQAVDAAAAKALSKKEDCTKCHSPEKEKKGPSLKKIAEKYKGKADAEAKAIENMTAGKKVKLDDGTEEDHPIIKTKDKEAMKNLAQWILSH